MQELTKINVGDHHITATIHNFLGIPESMLCLVIDFLFRANKSTFPINLSISMYIGYEIKHSIYIEVDMNQTRLTVMCQHPS